MLNLKKRKVKGGHICVSDGHVWKTTLKHVDLDINNLSLGDGLFALVEENIKVNKDVFMMPITAQVTNLLISNDLILFSSFEHICNRYFLNKEKFLDMLKQLSYVGLCEWEEWAIMKYLIEIYWLKETLLNMDLMDELDDLNKKGDWNYYLPKGFNLNRTNLLVTYVRKEDSIEFTIRSNYDSRVYNIFEVKINKELLWDN